MKIILLFISILSFGSNLLAQNNTFPTDNAIWTNQMRTYYLDNDGIPVFTTEWITKYCVSGIDTTINAINYTEVDICTALNSTYHGAIREDAGQIFFVPVDSTSEFLLYDFTLNVGESAYVLIQLPWGQPHEYIMDSVQVDYVDTIIVNNSPRRVINAGEYSWIEGIGATSGLFMEPYSNVSNYFIDLICVSTDDTIVYDYGNLNSGPLAQGIPGNCDLALTIDETDIASAISVYPSPTTGSIAVEIKGDNQIKTIRLINSIGQEISTITNLSSGITEFDIAGPTGIYFIEIYTEDNQKTVQKIIKH
ncbi:MAG: T9SS type A sorting domain-containing protein [Crocinitomicaceae bacterium]